MEKKRGLPVKSRKLESTHLVEELSGTKQKTIGRIISIDLIDLNPNQPRHDCGDLEELSQSIRSKGILEPLLVQPTGSRYLLIAGERRFRAAMLAGLKEVPCIEKNLTDNELMEISLIENLQRKDLHPFEESDGLNYLAQKFNYSHKQISRAIGKSRSTITEILSISTIPDDLRSACRSADISSKNLLIQIVRSGSPEKMWETFEQIIEGNKNRDHFRKIRSKKQGRPKNYTFRFLPENKSYRLNVSFRKSEVSPEEVLRTLEEIVESMKKQISVKSNKSDSTD